MVEDATQCTFIKDLIVMVQDVENVITFIVI